MHGQQNINTHILSYKLKLTSRQFPHRHCSNLPVDTLLSLLQSSRTVAIFSAWRPNTYVQQIRLNETFKFFDSLGGLKHLYTHQSLLTLKELSTH